MGDPILGEAYERLVTSQIGTEAGLGLYGAEAGTKFYLTPVSAGNLNFHTGISESWGVATAIGYNGFRT